MMKIRSAKASAFAGNSRRDTPAQVVMRESRVSCMQSKLCTPLPQKAVTVRPDMFSKSVRSESRFRYSSSDGILIRYVCRRFTRGNVCVQYPKLLKFGKI